MPRLSGTRKPKPRKNLTLAPGPAFDIRRSHLSAAESWVSERPLSTDRSSGGPLGIGFRKSLSLLNNPLISASVGRSFSTVMVVFFFGSGSRHNHRTTMTRQRQARRRRLPRQLFEACDGVGPG